MGGSGALPLPSVAAPNVGGVQITRNALHFEAQRSLGVARRVGRRLMRWLHQTQKQEIELERIVGRDPETGRNITELVNDPDGEPVMVPIIPDDDFRKAWDLYERTVRNLLIEQRARAAMTAASGAPAVSDEVFDAKVAELAKAAVLEMPRAELEALLAARRMHIVQGATNESVIAADKAGPASQPATRPDSPGRESGETPPGGDGDGEPPDLLDFGGGDDDR